MMQSNGLELFSLKEKSSWKEKLFCGLLKCPPIISYDSLIKKEQKNSVNLINYKKTKEQKNNKKASSHTH